MVFSPFLKEETEALRVGFSQLPKTSQGTCLQEKLRPQVIVSELRVCPVEADVSENQVGDWSLSLGTTAVRVTEPYSEPYVRKGPKRSSASTPHFAAEELSPERIRTWPGSFSQLVAYLEETAWLLIPRGCTAPDRPACHYQTQKHALTCPGMPHSRIRKPSVATLMRKLN